MTTQTRLPPFFANLLPEGHLRQYLAARAGVKPVREFPLLRVLGRDLPGAVTIRTAGEGGVPSQTDPAPTGNGRPRQPLRFSLAGIQLKFSALAAPSGGLAIPANGAGGAWIVKLPSARFGQVPEAEFAALALAAESGIDVPERRLAGLDEIAGLPDGIGDLSGKALVIRRFDRRPDGSPVHVEDFAQVFGVYPEGKYRAANMRGIAAVIADQGGNVAAAEFIRRLTFTLLIGNGDMHLKNWSLIYPDRRAATIAPAYDFVPTILFLPEDALALKMGRVRRFDEVTMDAFDRLAIDSRLPRQLVRDTAAQTVARFMDVWAREKMHLDLGRAGIARLDTHLGRLPLVRGG